MFEEWDAAQRQAARLEERRSGTRSYSPAFEKRD
jgi:hypothetical protein